MTSKEKLGSIQFQPKDTNAAIYDQKPNSILPLDVTRDLTQYSRFFVTKEFDYFKIVHKCEDYLHDYKVFGELPDEDKKLLFTNVAGIIALFLFVVVALMSVAIPSYFN